MYCKHILKNNRYCKNHAVKQDLCHLHYSGKRLHFNIGKNETVIVDRYIHTLEKLKSGKWKYQPRKSWKKSRKN